MSTQLKILILKCQRPASPQSGAYKNQRQGKIWPCRWILYFFFAVFVKAFAAFNELLPRCSASVIKAFHNAQPLARDQVSLSSERAVRNASRLSPEKNVHAIVTSHAGSPTPEEPKSITAFNRPLVTSKFPALTSPCIQTGEPCHRVFRAASHAAATALRSIMPPKSLMA